MSVKPFPAKWRKSSASGAGNDCVELAYHSGFNGVRDSKNPGAYLTVSIPALVTWVRAQ